MTPIERARKALEGWEPRCQRTVFVSSRDGQTYTCGLREPIHQMLSHPFTHDPAADTSPEAALAALLAELEAATAREATLREHLAMATDALDVWVSGSHRVTGGRCPHRADGPCTSHRVLAECRAALAPAPEADR